MKTGALAIHHPSAIIHLQMGIEMWIPLQRASLLSSYNKLLHPILLLPHLPVCVFLSSHIVYAMR